MKSRAAVAFGANQPLQVAFGANQPLQIVEIEDGQQGLLFDFFDTSALVESVNAVLSNPQDYVRMRARARETIVERYDLRAICLPQWLNLLS